MWSLQLGKSTRVTIMDFDADVSYDEREDSLYIYKKGEDVKYSLDFEFGVIDFNYRENVVGIEILEASEFLSDVDKDLLNQAEGGKVWTVKKKGVIGAKFIVKLPKKEIQDSMIVPGKKAKA